MKTILDFCVDCGSLLPPGLGNEEDPQCPNCGTFVKERNRRIQGEFEQDQARLLQHTYGYAV